jgi:hypothetical protein
MDCRCWVRENKNVLPLGGAWLPVHAPVNLLLTRARFRWPKTGDARTMRVDHCRLGNLSTAPARIDTFFVDGPRGIASSDRLVQSRDRLLLQITAKKSRRLRCIDGVQTASSRPHGGITTG